MCTIRSTLYALLIDHFTLEEIEEERPVGTCLMTAVMLTVGEAPLHQTIVHARKEVGAYALITEQFVDG